MPAMDAGWFTADGGRPATSLANWSHIGTPLAADRCGHPLDVGRFPVTWLRDEAIKMTRLLVCFLIMGRNHLPLSTEIQCRFSSDFCRDGAAFAWFPPERRLAALSIRFESQSLLTDQNGRPKSALWQR
jgi:hypothetical protein